MKEGRSFNSDYYSCVKHFNHIRTYAIVYVQFIFMHTCRDTYRYIALQISAVVVKMERVSIILHAALYSTGLLDDCKFVVHLLRTIMSYNTTLIQL